MGDFINGLLGEKPSVNKMAEAMQAAPRANPRDRIDQPTASEQPEQGAPQQPSPEEQEAQAFQQRQQGKKTQGKAPAPHDGPILTEGGEEAEVDTRSGAAMPAPSADEEKQARVLMANVTDFLYGDGMSKVSKFLKSGKEVPKAVGEITAMLVSGELDAAEMAEQEISPDILMSVGAEVVSQVYELAAALGVWAPADEKQTDQDMSLSLNYAANLFVNQSVQNGRKDRLKGLPTAMQDIEAGKYDSKPGSPLTNDMAPEPGGLL